MIGRAYEKEPLWNVHPEPGKHNANEKYPDHRRCRFYRLACGAAVRQQLSCIQDHQPRQAHLCRQHQQFKRNGRQT